MRRWRRHLAAVGGPNTLLWFGEPEEGTLELTHAHPGGLARLLAGRETRLSDLMREHDALSDARHRARAVRGKVTELFREHGLEVGYLAIGMATWRPAGTNRTPAAPVLLRRCTLTPVDPTCRDYTVDLGRDVEVNPALVHYLRAEEDLEVDPEGLARLAVHQGGFDPDPVYAALGRLCGQIPGFTIAPRLVVSTFSYAKLPMVADLSGSRHDLADHRVVAALAAGQPLPPRTGAAGNGPQPGQDEPAAAREGSPPRPAWADLDGDADQLAVVEAVLAGDDLVVDAPPGTGRSETVAHLVAALAARGQRVLLVAGKRTSLERVQARLHAQGLGDLLLDVRDGIGGHRARIEELRAALETGQSVTPPDTLGTEEALASTRARLEEHVVALHETREPWGVTAYRAQEEIVALAGRPHPPRTRVRLKGEQLAAIDRERLAQLGDLLEAAADAEAWDTEGRPDPWFGARIETAEEVSRALDISTRRAQDGLGAVQRTFDEVFAELRIPPAHSAADFGTFLAAIERVRDTLEIFRPEVYDQPLDTLVAATGSAADRVAADISAAEGWRLRRQVRQLLRPGTPPEDLHGALQEAQQQRNDWASMAGAGGRPALPADVDRAHTAYEELHEDLTWLGDRLGGTPEGGDLLSAPLEELGERFDRLAGRDDRLAVLPEVLPTLDRLDEAGLAPLVHDLSERGVPAGAARDELVFLWWTSIVEHLMATDQRFAGPHGEELRQAARDFADADRAGTRVAATRIRAEIAGRRAGAVREHPDQVATLVQTAENPGPTLGELLAETADVALALRPCWAMSPLVVAQNIPPGEWFDVAVIDQAGQVATAEAISAISRAGQVVAVGDEHQLAPSRWSATIGADVDTETPSGPSILAELGAVASRRGLRWDRRYRDQRLVGLSNTLVYGDRIITFPAADDRGVVTLDLVDGRGVVDTEDGVVEWTVAEVARVVDLVIEHASQRPHESLAVITATAAQATAVEDALIEAVAENPALLDLMSARDGEPLLVVPVDLAQGDSREAVIFSTGFGRTVHGRVLHRFGPLSAAGGERRVNVALTRARSRLTVVSSLSAEDLDPSRLRSPGAVLLRQALAYAGSGGEHADEGPRPPQSFAPSIGLLEQDLAERLRRSGLTVHERLGGGAQPVGIAVDDPLQPGVHLMAIESDGPDYASIEGVRERDRLRVESLARRGWHHVRVWTTDLFRDPGREEARVLAEIRRATSSRGAPEGWAGDAPSPSEAPATPSAQHRSVRPHPSDQTRDDTDAGWGEVPDRDAHDRWLQEQRPPHWE